MNKPVIAVLGHHNSGKTTVIENIITKLREIGYRVASAKHVFIEGFSIDRENTDTYRHSSAGANPVIGVSDVETFIILKNGVSDFSTDKVESWASEADVLVLEGFSHLVSDSPEVGKILCIKSREEITDFKREVKGRVLAFCSLKRIYDDVLMINEDSSLITERVLTFIKEFSH
jgi:molybdopterin-guanine dinucleotide biosynthesis protein MobB